MGPFMAERSLELVSAARCAAQLSVDFFPQKN